MKMKPWRARYRWFKVARAARDRFVGANHLTLLGIGAIAERVGRLGPIAAETLAQQRHIADARMSGKGLQAIVVGHVVPRRLRLLQQILEAPVRPQGGHRIGPAPAGTAGQHQLPRRRWRGPVERVQTGPAHPPSSRTSDSLI